MDKISELKKLLPVYLEKKLGINIDKPFCCVNPEHMDNNPSMSYDKKRNKIHCFSCGVDWDIFDLVGALENIQDKKEIFKLVESFSDFTDDDIKDTYTHKDIHTSSYTQPNNDNDMSKKRKPYLDTGTTPVIMDYFKKCHKKINETNYLKNRGLSDETLNKFLIGFEPNFTEGTSGEVWQAIIIPTSGCTYIARNTDMTNTDTKKRVRKHGPSLLFNYKRILEQIDDYIFIVEGEIDAMSIEEVGANAVGLGGVGNIRKLIEMLKDCPPKKPLLIALDNDEAGKKATEELIEELDKIKVKYYYSSDFYGEYKDANEFLVKDRQGLINNINEALNYEKDETERRREEYLKNATSNYLQGFLDGIKDSVNTPYIPTGFPKLDNIFDGGFYEGLYVVGAISSLGKTTLVMQIADQVAQGGKDVLIFSLEMARTELMAKSISRNTLLEALDSKMDSKNAKTTRGITTGTRYANYSETERNLIYTSVLRYGMYADKIFIHEGVGDIGVEQIKETIEKHIEYTGNIPLVVIDYIQILAPYDVRATDKQNIDHAVMELKRISRDLKLPIIGISSFNRTSYKEKVGMEAFKESGALEYGSDVLIGLQLKGAGTKGFDVDQAKQKAPREVELVILKNRNGATGKTVDFLYYPMFNYFKEV